MCHHSASRHTHPGFPEATHITHSKEGHPGQEAIAAGLVLRAQTLYVQLVTNILEAAFETLAALRHVLDIVNVGKVEPTRGTTPGRVLS